MNYKKGLRLVREMNVAGGPGGAMGYGGANTIGQHGGAVGNDADAWKNSYTNVPIEYLHGNGKKDKKGRKKIPKYRRKFAEMMTKESCDTELILNGVLFTEVSEYKQVTIDMLENLKIPYVLDSGCVIIEGTDEFIQDVVNRLQGIITPEPFEDGHIAMFVCEMDISKDNIPGGKAEGKSLEDFYHKYDSKGYYDIRNFEEEFNKKLDAGIKVEMEHTTDREIAKEIACDHLWEDLEYYTKLAKIEKK